MSHEPSYYERLITTLRGEPAETGWLEFKVNNDNPEEIGKYLSALSNTAAIHSKPSAYVVWGIDDKTHDVVGTRFRPSVAKKGNENLENWLLHLLTPRIEFEFRELPYADKPVVLLEIAGALHRPTRFKGVEWIRVGSHLQKLADYPQIEAALWRSFDKKPFEEAFAASDIQDTEVLDLLDYSAYFACLNGPLPDNRIAILDRFLRGGIIARNQAGSWDITNFGAILFARDLNRFRRLGRKAVRVIEYHGTGRLATIRERVWDAGYAASFEHITQYVTDLLPQNEVIQRFLRRDVPMYPPLAIRELIANALIHQDLTVVGAGPMIEVFDDRMEITNPGKPLIETDRLLDNPPVSRNEMVASFMRRIGVCEERGSGIDKVVQQTELFQLPAPIFEAFGESTQAVLFAHKELRHMERNDRVRACYLHACLRYVEKNAMTNASLRERFGIADKNAAIASRMIREALDDGVINPYDPNQGKKFARYVPYWS